MIFYRYVNRLCMEDTVVYGQIIPAGVVVQPDIWTIHYDKDLWGPVDPHEFEPERYVVERIILITAWTAPVCAVQTSPRFKENSLWPMLISLRGPCKPSP